MTRSETATPENAQMLQVKSHLLCRVSLIKRVAKFSITSNVTLGLPERVHVM